jgi:hypothetical protein
VGTESGLLRPSILAGPESGPISLPLGRLLRYLYPGLSGVQKEIMRHRSLLVIALLFSACSKDQDTGVDSQPVVNNILPQCTFLTPDSNSSVDEGVEVVFSGTVSDEDGSSDELLVTLSSDLDGELEGLTTNDAGDWTLTSSTLGVGTHQLIVDVVDDDGGECEAQILFTVGNPPAVAIIAPELDASFGTNGPVQFDALVSDDVDSPETLLLVWEHADFGVFDEAFALEDGSVQVELADLDPGEHAVTLTVTDSQGFYAVASVDFLVNATPSAPGVSISPSDPSSSDLLSAVLTEASDEEGDPLTYTYAWLVDGVATAFSTSTIDADQTLRDEIWTVEVAAWDGTSTGESAQAQVTIGNSVPEIARVTVSPDPAVAADNIRCSHSGWFDTDGDADASVYSWQLNGTDVGDSSDTFVGGHIGGDVVTCIVTPNDGYEDGAAVSSSVTIGNTAPVLADATLSPRTAYEASTLTCTPGASSDVDGDAVSFTTTWTVAGSDPGVTTSTLSGTYFDSGDAVTCTVTPTDGSATGASVVSNSVTISNTAPVMGTVSLSPTEVREGDTLSCSGVGTDVDGDSLSYSYAWTVDGSDPGVTSSSISSDYFDSGDAIVCTLTVSDGSATDSSTATLVASNTAPTMVSVTLSPSTVYESSTVLCTPTSADVDGDSVSYTYAWTVGGSTVSETSSELTGTDFDRDEELICIVTPTDGTDAGSALSSAGLTVSNTPPVVSSVSISPSSGTEATTFSCSISGSDEDGDALSSSYVWTVNGSSISTASTLSGSDFDRGDAVICIGTLSDGSDSASSSSSSVTVLNTAPTMSSVTLTPSSATEASTLTCTASASDVDGDTLSFTYAWSVDGSTISQTSSTLTGTYFARDQAVFCSVTPSDGSDSGSPLSSGSVTISNTAPSVGTPSISPSTAYEGSTLSCVAGATSDIDGDSVSLTYAWTIGSSTVGTSATLTGSDFDKGDTVLCTTTPSDGSLSGTAVSSSSLTISNTAPSDPSGISISPSAPTSGDDLLCDVGTLGTDVDGDSVSHDIVWTLDSSTWTGSTTTDTHAGDTIDAADVSGDDVWACHVTAYDGSGYSGQVSSSSVTVTPETTTYNIELAELDGLGSSCASGTYYDGCSGSDWGFTWTDTYGVTPVGVVVELYHGIFCSGSTTKSPDLNGVAAGSFVLSGGSCTCDPTKTVNTWTLTDISGYSPGASNTFTINSSGSCEGLSANASWGAGVYARVTVSY